ncbi:MAG: DUF4255 domain-containing protein [Bacteroidota bacterium]
MIDNALNTLRTKLNTYFKNLGETTDDKVIYLNEENGGDSAFQLNKVTLVMVNMEEERTLRQADPYAGQLQNGVLVGRNPEVRLHLIVMFVARFGLYEQGIKSISQIIRFFQAHRIFQQLDTPDLDPDIDRLIVELQTMPISEQNELWNAFRSPYFPSVAYRVSLLRYRDEMNMELGAEIQSIERTLKHS